LDSNDAAADVVAPRDSVYSGPFLLPVIDLINHSSEKKCTTLHRVRARDQDVFVMMAEHSVSAGEEILHSYGDLTAGQCLQTFGFVPETAVQRAASSSSASSTNFTPAILSKTEDILPACWEVIESDLPSQLAASMQEQNMEDEIWTVKVDRNRKTDFLPNELLISVDSDNMWTDELVTVTCLPFLPACAASEITARTLLDRSMLEDYYLCKLVCTAMLKAIDKKLKRYTSVQADEWPTDDQELLIELLASKQVDTPSSQRLMYGLTVRLEEKQSLATLRGEVIATLVGLDSDKQC
jgi:hypothetical protein